MGSSFELFVRLGVWGVALNLIVGIVGGIGGVLVENWWFCGVSFGMLVENWW